MKHASFLYFFLGTFAWLTFCSEAEDPYRYYTWTVTYGTISPLGVPQQGILINGQFPGPTVECVTNDNIIVNVINKLDEHFLITWNGIKQRKTVWQDGVLGTNCPIPPNSNWTYKFQAKDQIGTFNYFPSTQMHRASGGFGGFNIDRRSVISLPYPIPAEEYTLLVGDWYNAGHKALRERLDSGYSLPLPNGLHINGRRNSIFTGQKGKTIKLRVSNVGITTTINFRIQGHNMVLVEVEGSHTLQEVYTSIDIFPGQSVSVLVTLSNQVKDYFIVASTRFTNPILNVTAILRYGGSTTKASGPLPIGPSYHVHWSVKQARTFRLNLTANAARPNPQGSFHYGQIPRTRTVILTNTAAKINGKQRFAVNGISYVNPETPLKLADRFNISGVFNYFTKFDGTSKTPPKLGTYVINTTLHDFVEIVFQNTENVAQSWHTDGTSFYVVGYGFRTPWTKKMRRRYNLADAVPRHTVQVYPNSWTAILVSFDNKGMWNLRSTDWGRRYLGQELYLKVWNDETSVYTESDVPPNALFCGKAKRP